MSFGVHLRALIEERNLTQKELALQLNIAPSTLSSYVQNTREPDFETLKVFARYFDVSIDYLLDYHTGKSATQQEDELLRVFRSLSAEQKDICIEQCKVFLRMNQKEKTAVKLS
ncbi:MAG: helix-turn-helix transcriptional regulator [Clostridia bacterium]|nr:helix-turn-helix transcriptional regulator [Clostridia bacterium]